MTLTSDRRSRAVTQRRVPAAEAARTLTVEPVLTDVYRVVDATRVVGYIQLAGPVYVSLLGAVYNTSCEVGQSLDLDTAVAILDRSR